MFALLRFLYIFCQGQLDPWKVCGMKRCNKCKIYSFRPAEQPGKHGQCVNMHCILNEWLHEYVYPKDAVPAALAATPAGGGGSSGSNDKTPYIEDVIPSPTEKVTDDEGEPNADELKEEVDATALEEAKPKEKDDEDDDDQDDENENLRIAAAYAAKRGKKRKVED